MKFTQKILNKIDWIYNTYRSRKVEHMPNIEVLGFNESMDVLVKNKSSLARFGDGELSLMLNGEFLRKREKPLRFQRVDNKLKKRLQEVMWDPNIDSYNLKLGISSAIKKADLETYTDEAWHFWKNYLVEIRYKIYAILRKNYPYIDTLITRFYMDYRDKSEDNVQYKVSRLKQLWDGEELLIIEGGGSRLGLNNDLFNNVNSIERIACPNSNAFDKYDQILESAKRYGHNKVIVLALGPTATVLAYDLAKSGFRALDLGHIDIEYEWFLMKATTKVQIQGKIMTEVLDSNQEINFLDTEYIYQSQLVAKID